MRVRAEGSRAGDGRGGGQGRETLSLGGSEPESFANTRQVGRQRNHKLASRRSATGDSLPCCRGLKRRGASVTPLLCHSRLLPFSSYLPIKHLFFHSKKRQRNLRITILGFLQYFTSAFVSLCTYLYSKNDKRVCGVCAVYLLQLRVKKGREEGALLYTCVSRRVGHYCMYLGSYESESEGI
jgi:hypothetical protein